MARGSAYRSRRFAKALRILATRHIFTRPYTPKTNGKASPSRSCRTDGGGPLDSQTLRCEGASGLSRQSANARNQDLPRWLDGFNRARPHSALNGTSPLEWVNNLPGLHS